MVIKIINDTDLDITYDILNDNKLYLHQEKHKALSCKIYRFTKSNNIRICKTDIWQEKDKISGFLNFIFIFDLEFGNLSETNSLPYSIDYQENNFNDIHEYYLSKILKIDNHSFNKWQKNCNIQINFIVILFLIIGVALSFLFKNIIIKWIFLVVLTVMICFLKHNLNIHKKEIIKKLLKISTNDT